MKNPYEPPKHKKPKYQEPLIDWEGLIMVVTVLFVVPVIFLFLLGCFLRWVE
jgi:hypothetical protein